MKLNDKTQKSTTINGKRYNYARLVKSLLKTTNKAGNYYIDESTEAIKRCLCVVFVGICGKTLTIEA